MFWGLEIYVELYVKTTNDNKRVFSQQDKLTELAENVYVLLSRGILLER